MFMFYHNIHRFIIYFHTIVIIESEGSESSDGFEKKASTSQEYHIENENNSLIAIRKRSVSNPNIENISNQNSDIQFLLL